MNTIKLLSKTLIAITFLTGFSYVNAETPTNQIAQQVMTQAELKKLTPKEALNLLKEGNQRFVQNKPVNYDYPEIRTSTVKEGQHPFAMVLGCMDSRGAPDIIFDQGLGNIFAARVAGNVADTDVIGSMEFAINAIGTKLIVVMGHTHCGAVVGACSGVKMQNLEKLLEKIEPAVEQSKKALSISNCRDPKLIHLATKQNVINQINKILKASKIVKEKHENGEILIVGAMHDLESGKVKFFSKDGQDMNIDKKS